jgi:hypothetical protein
MAEVDDMNRLCAKRWQLSAVKIGRKSRGMNSLKNGPLFFFLWVRKRPMLDCKRVTRGFTESHPGRYGVCRYQSGDNDKVGLSPPVVSRVS